MSERFCGSWRIDVHDNEIKERIGDKLCKEEGQELSQSVRCKLAARPQFGCSP